MRRPSCHFDRSIAIDPDAGFMPYHDRGVAPVKMGRHAEADLRGFHPGDAAAPKQERPSPGSLRGCTRADMKDFAEAIVDLNEAIRLDPRVAGFYHARGMAQAQLKDHLGAVEDFTMTRLRASIPTTTIRSSIAVWRMRIWGKSTTPSRICRSSSAGACAWRKRARGGPSIPCKARRQGSGGWRTLQRRSSFA